MKKYKTILLSIAMIIGFGALPLVGAPSVLAQNPGDEEAAEESTGGGPAGQIQDAADQTGLSGGLDLETQITVIVNVLMFLVSAIAVIVLIIGGIKYITSDGDQAKMKGAKDTILYAIIGIVVAILAYAIVRFVVDAFVVA